MKPTPSLAHFVWLCTPSRGRTLRPGEAGSAGAHERAGFAAED